MQRELPGEGRTFRRRSAKLWEIWPICEPTGEIHRVVHVDGIHLGHEAVVLIACSREHVIAWHVARSESTQAWMDLLIKIPPPDMVVTDGGTGFTTARKRIWPLLVFNAARSMRLTRSNAIPPRGHVPSVAGNCIGSVWICCT